MELNLECGHVEMGVVPLADAFSGTVSTDIFNMKNHGRITFVRIDGAGGTGTSTVTVEACDDVVPTNTTAVPFRYRKTVAGADPGAWVLATASGFATAAGANQIYEIEVLAEDIGATGYGYVRAKFVEVANDPVTGAVIAVLSDARHQGATHTTATT